MGWGRAVVVRWWAILWRWTTGITAGLGVVGCEEGVGGTLAFEAGDPVPEGVAGLVEIADV